MKKIDELSDPNSCLNKAEDDELVFVLLERDKAAADTIRFWAKKRVELRLNTITDPQILDAMLLSYDIDFKEK